MYVAFAFICGCCHRLFGNGTIAQGGDVTSSSVLGRKAENFTLNDFYGKSHSLADFKDKKVVVLAFLGTECPLRGSMARDWPN